MLRKLVGLLGASLALLALISCKPGSPEEKNTYKAHGAGAELSASEYNNMPPLQQYQVANRLLSALFRGVPAKEFFDPNTFTSGKEADLRVDPDHVEYIQQIKEKLGSHLENRDVIYTKVVGDTTVQPTIPGLYQFSSDERTPMELPLAYMYELPLSDEYFARWIAYNLMNTILFSPAEEIDSAGPEDARAVFDRLSEGIRNKATIRSLIYQHEISLQNWRRFRSPEDNTREMIEIYLGLFDRDADVPKAAKACKNWSLTDEDQGYLLLHPEAANNTEPQQILDHYWVTTCEDVMDTIANHPLVIPRMANVIVDHLFDANYDPQKKAKFVNSIVGAHPQTFSELYALILFSKEFLTSVERPKFIEESLFNVAGRVYWTPTSTFFRDLAGTSGTGGNLSTNMLVMNQPAMSLKLGRWASVPLDSQGFSYYHRALRDVVMLRRKTTYDNPYDGNYMGWGAELIGESVETVSGDAFINYLFISVIGRPATDGELAELNNIITTATANGGTGSKVFDPAPTSGNGIIQKRRDTALVVLDYLSRLPELYFYDAVN